VDEREEKNDELSFYKPSSLVSCSYYCSAVEKRKGMKKTIA
jgi:hypothetical protein